MNTEHKFLDITLEMVGYDKIKDETHSKMIRVKSSKEILLVVDKWMNDTGLRCGYDEICLILDINGELFKLAIDTSLPILSIGTIEFKPDILILDNNILIASESILRYTSSITTLLK